MGVRELEDDVFGFGDGDRRGCGRFEWRDRRDAYRAGEEAEGGCIRKRW